MSELMVSIKEIKIDIDGKLELKYYISVSII